MLLAPRYHHFCDLQGRTGNPPSKDEIASHQLNAREHLLKRARNGYFFDRISEFSVFDPKSARAAGIVPSHHVNTEPDQFRYIEPLSNARDDFLFGLCARHEI